MTAPAPLTARAMPRALAMAMAHAACLVALAGSAGPVAAAASEKASPPQGKASAPGKAAAVGSLAATAQNSPGGAAGPAGSPAEDAMERLRQRLTERLAVPGAAPVTGTLELQVGTRALTPVAPKAAAPMGGGAPATPRRAEAGEQGAAASRAPGPAAQALAGAQPMVRRAAAGAAPGLPTPAAMQVAAPALAAAHAALPTAAAAAVPAPARRVLPSTLAGRGHAAGAHWGYEGATGPAAWGAVRPEFGLCANGQRQSPIDIRGGLAVELEPVRFDYKPSAFSVIDNGHTVQVNLPPGNAIEVSGRRYELQQFHFHRPSEERIDGRQFEMSLHLVHKDAEGRLAVVGVLLGKGPAHPAVQMVWNNLPLEKHQEAAARAQLDPSHLLPRDQRYYTYMGSLTTPPCSEGVLWVVMRTPVTLTEEQIELFARLYPMNARPAQPLAGRRIMQSQ